MICEKKGIYETFHKKTVCNNLYNTYDGNHTFVLVAEFDVA